MSENSSSEKKPRSPGKEILLRISFTLLSTLATLIVFEISFRVTAFLPEYQLQLKTLSGPSSVLHIVLDPELLFRVKPKSRSDINTLGYREREVSTEKSRPRILVYGDSFIMANNILQGESIPARMDAALDAYEVLNFGISGYGPDQLLLRAEKEVSLIQPDILILSIFAGNDLADLLANELFVIDNKKVKKSNENIVTRSLPFFRTEMLLRMVFYKQFLPTETETILRDTLVFDETVHVSEFSNDEQEKLEYLLPHVLGEWKKLAAARSIPLHILLIPSWRGTHEEPAIFENEALIAKYCHMLEIPLLDARELVLSNGPKELYDQSYRHLNARGAALLADALVNKLKQDGVIEHES